MGIRIHKVLGYGLTDVKVKQFAIADPRFNMVDGYFSYNEDPPKNKFTTPGYIDYMKASKDEHTRFDAILVKQNSKAQVRSGDWYSYDFEMGKKGVVCFTPLCYPDWKRYDDVIDYYEARSNMVPTVKLLNKPIYPFDSYHDKKTGLGFVEKDGHKFSLGQIMQTAEFLSKKENKALKTSKEFFNGFDFDDEKDFWARVIPAIPRELIALLEYTKVFNDRQTIFDLKPMIYSYWS
jgi:hypothetical protein